MMTSTIRTVDLDGVPDGYRAMADREALKGGDQAVTGWTSEELDRIGTAQELEVAALRADGTLRQPVTIWVVREGDDRYVRSWRGRSGAWYRGVLERHQGHIRAGGVDKDVDFVTVDDEERNERIDAAYRAKYGRYGSSYIQPMTSGETRTTTLRLEPRAAKGAA